MLNETTRLFILDHRFDDIRKLALKVSSTTDPNIDIHWALTQIEGRRYAENKIPTWSQIDDIVYPPHLALEQCSSEHTARYKAQLLSGTSFVDMTGGFGVDFAFISRKFHESYYVEKQQELCEIVASNFKLLGLTSARIIHTTAFNFLKSLSSIDTIFIDPGRRHNSGKKVIRLEQTEPNLLKLQDLLIEKAQSVLIKLSPMLDISLALKQLKNVSEVHIVSLENECKELLFLIKKDYIQEPIFTCVNLSRKNNQPSISFLLSQEKEKQINYTSETGQYIYEPNTSLIKAGFYKGLTDFYPLRKFHPDSHLYTSDRFVSDFPGRVFQLERYTSFNKKELKNFMCDIDKATLSIRNFPLPVAELRKKLRIKDGGDVFLFATTLANGKHILLKTKKYLY